MPKDPRQGDVPGPGDTLYYGVNLPYGVVIPVLGVPVQFASNSSLGIAAAEDAFGRWKRLDRDAPALVSEFGPMVRLIVTDEGPDDPMDAPVTTFMPDAERLIMRTPGSVAIVDTARDDGVAFVTRGLLADPMQVRHRVLPGIVLTLITGYDRVPVHASVIAKGDAALLLAGPAGTGKSTLAWRAAGVSGARVLSDDAAYIQRSPELRVWGVPGRSLLMPDARERFRELEALAPRTVADGSQKIVVEHAAEWPAPGAAPPVARKAGVVLLSRDGDGPVRQSPARADEIRAFLKAGVGLTAPRIGRELDATYDVLARRGGWKLTLTDDPDDAMPFVASMLDQLSGARS